MEGEPRYARKPGVGQLHLRQRPEAVAQATVFDQGEGGDGVGGCLPYKLCRGINRSKVIVQSRGRERRGVGRVTGIYCNFRRMDLKMKQEGKFEFLETGGAGEPLLLLHGLFGGLSNFGAQIETFGEKFNVLVPTLPMMTLPLRKVSLAGLVDHLADFVVYKGFEQVHLMGNSLGGHVGILYAIDHPGRIASITLTGSSGLFESAMGNSFPPRGNYEFIKKKVESTFFDPATSSKALVDEVYNTVNDRSRGIRIVMTAKSAVRHNLAHKLHHITAPTLLIWGKQDTITPPFVGEQFKELIDDAELHFIDRCAHAPMMEQPQKFNHIMGNFLQRVTAREPSPA